MTTQTTEFDYDQVSRDLGEPLPKTHPIHTPAEIIAIRRIEEWIIGKKAINRRTVSQAGYRALAMVFVTNPALLSPQAQAPSLRAFCSQLGCDPAQLSPVCAEFKRHFHIHPIHAIHPKKPIKRSRSNG